MNALKELRKLRRDSLLLVFNTRRYGGFSRTLEKRVREERLLLALEREARYEQA